MARGRRSGAGLTRCGAGAGEEGRRRRRRDPTHSAAPAASGERETARVRAVPSPGLPAAPQLRRPAQRLLRLRRPRPAPAAAQWSLSRGGTSPEAEPGLAAITCFAPGTSPPGFPSLTCLRRPCLNERTRGASPPSATAFHVAHLPLVLWDAATRVNNSSIKPIRSSNLLPIELFFFGVCFSNTLMVTDP